MLDRPIAEFRDGRLWLDSGFAEMGSVSRFDVWMRGATLARSLEIAEENGLESPWTREKLAECIEALRAFDEHERETQCEAATV